MTVIRQKPHKLLTKLGITTIVANMSYPYTRSLTYVEFPTKFVWKDDSSKWFPRKKGFAIGRLTHVPAELTMSDDEIKQLCLIDIDKILHFYGTTLKDYPHMPLATEVDNFLLTERVIREELNFNRDDLKKNASNIGTEKIFLWNLMSAEIRSRGDIVLNIALSGIASLLLPNRITAHSRFKIPLNITEEILKDLSFGGKVVVLGGDFRQILPVIPRESRQDIVHSTVNSSYLWKFCQVVKLTKNMRLSVGMTASDQDETEQFGEWLLKVGDGLIGDNMDGESEICLPGDIVNNHLMAIIPGGEKLYLISNSICMDEGNMESQLDLYGPELLNSINCSGLPPHKLILKVGVPVMLLRNIDQSSGLCNGTRLQVRKLENHVIECEVLSGNNVGHIALISRMNMVPTNETVPVRFQRRQFSIIVSFAMSINKSQGQTLSHVGLYLPRPVFTHGQLYVALSRVKSKRGLKVLLMNYVGMSANSTINVIYKEVFEKIVF
ncbi:ATP-dependent DNA helicase PIF1-like [Arachis ipaensis]|uniref:ATP-dependent DNA helicase PIF1-like n=1 Tax=Arachis ipaensis TaxID=130454 RepID=UPI0007AEFD91|nr:ATP-dependent DNA helicase PIF1-like [Arachis ipaensis]XP_025669865.1 ATP-dependent DNA helicase PIF1-like [Arachis hypogaea]